MNYQAGYWEMKRQTFKHQRKTSFFHLCQVQLHSRHLRPPFPPSTTPQAMLNLFGKAMCGTRGWGHGTAFSLCCSWFPTLFSCWSFLLTDFLGSSMSPPQAAVPSDTLVPSWTTYLTPALKRIFLQCLSSFVKWVLTEAPCTWLMGSAVSCGGSPVGPAGTMCVRNTMSLRKDSINQNF